MVFAGDVAPDDAVATGALLACQMTVIRRISLGVITGAVTS